jgi:hypothetical protein
MRLNGIGTGLLNATKVADDGTCMAYKVFTFLYAPIFPIAKIHFKRRITKSNSFELEWEEKVEMQAMEILWIYLKGWIVYPIILFTPLAISVIEVYTALGLPPDYYNWCIGFAITYLAVVVWILADRYEEQGLPKGYKQLLKEQNFNKK